MRRAALVIFIAVFAFFLADGRLPVGMGDSIPARYIPLTIVGHGTVFLDPVKGVAVEGHAAPYWAQPSKIDGKLGSLFPIWTPVLIAPAYVPAAMLLNHRGWDKDRLEAVGLIMERLSAAALSAAAVAILFLALVRRGVPLRQALLLTFAFAFATGTWSTSSQALWLHALAELCCALVLLCLTKKPTVGMALAAGIAVGLLACNRTPDVILAAGLGVAALLWAERRWWFVVAGAGAIGAVTLFYILYVWHHLLGAWGMTGVSSPRGVSFWEGIAGQLVSPTRGLLVFSPFLLFVPLGILASLREEKERLITLSLAAGVVGLICVNALYDWRAGHSYGPRYLVDAMPVCIWLLAPALQRMSRVTLGAMVLLIGFSVWVQYVGVFHYTGISNVRIFAKDKDWVPYWPLTWDVSNTPFLVEWANPRQHSNVGPYLRRL